MEKLAELRVNVYLSERMTDGADNQIPSVTTLSCGKEVPYDLLVSGNFPRQILILTGDADQMHWPETSFQHSLDIVSVFDLELCHDPSEKYATDS